MRAEDIDFDKLTTYLKALAHPARLELLWRLRIPAAPGDVTIRPRRRDEGLSQERPMSRQSVMEHVEQLEEVGVVNRVENGTFVTSAQHLFAIVEDLRKLSAIETSLRVDVDSTLQQAGPVAASWPAGAKLVVVGGPWEGRAFPLAGAGPWTIGRAASQSVGLTYDPYASHESARVSKDAAAWRLEPVAGARNPPRVNFAPVDKPRALRSGDIVGVGRSLLVFQES